MNLYLVEFVLEGDKEPFEDWYWGHTEADAIQECANECVRFGGPVGTVKSCRLATEQERKAITGK